MTVQLIDEETVSSRIKLGIWGDSGTGKTSLGLSFPKVVAIDTEGGTTNYKHDHAFALLRVYSLADFNDAVDTIRRELKKRPDRWETVMCDPITRLRDNGNDAALRPGSEDLSFAQRAQVNRTMRRMYSDLIGLGLHTVVTAWEGIKYRTEGKTLINEGEKADTDKAFNYFFDFVFRTLKKETQKGEEYYAQVLKARNFHLPGELKGRYIKDPSFGKHLADIAAVLNGGQVVMHEPTQDEVEAADRGVMDTGESHKSAPKPKPAERPPMVDFSDSLSNKTWAEKWIADDPRLNFDIMKAILSDGDEPLVYFTDCKLTVPEANNRIMDWQVQATLAAVPTN